MNRLTRNLIDSILCSIPMMALAALVMIWIVSLAGCTSKRNTTIEIWPDDYQERREPVVSPSPAPSQQVQAPAPVLSPETVYFGLDRFDLTEDAQSVLDGVAGLVGPSERGLMVITGGACPIGEDEYNWDLGFRRALAVEIYLRNAGVLMEFELRSVGEADLVALDRDEYWRNRRVEIEVR